MNADKVLDTKDKSIQFVKNRIFDFIALGIVVAMTVLSLGVLELREITPAEIIDIVIENVPFFLATMMLSTNYYNKGTFTGKQSNKFLDTVDYYSKYVEDFTGKQIDILPDFCKHYNERSLRRIKEDLLKTVAITWKKYDEGENGEKPLKIVPYKKLKETYGKYVAKTINNCKKLKIKGIHVNILLGNLNSSDPTDLGKNEKELYRIRKIGYAGSYLFFTFVMALIGIKNIFEWGWIGVLFVLFKLLYIVCTSYMKYFEGYEDICTNLVNHIYRKTDILKEFDCWYNHNCVTINEVSEK